MSIQNDTFILSNRGWLISGVLGALFLFFSMTGLHLFQFIFGALLLSVLIIFRNPERNTSETESDAVISSVDGIVLSVEESIVDDQKMSKVTVMNSLWDVSMLRAPFDCEVEGFKIRHGASLPLYHPLSDTLNEKAVISFRSKKGDEIYIEHLSEQSCFPIGIELEKSQKFKEGTRYGFLAKGRSVIYLPASARVSVNAGASVRAGESVIGYLNAA
ncbi:MAG: phosphatidylserine decarboxylase [Sulfuricurvum sp.]|uniref:phosphatidylserine decarboxylase n=1 Tax=Sulfuricurvum sp. TaxID=2025608 RepID=UPI0025F71B01|nr:phosphatidylserine decarboxylase [Sulfuricurvum sp.]MCI4406610.1 phosphatidylserine decarboxylase [Sulfuricurvum sp.]